MPDCQCDRLDRTFDSKTARNDLRDYLRDGPDSSTKQLLSALQKGGVEGRTLLDIGGGVGTIQLELLGAGLAAATDVDVSGAYVEVARLEAAKRGFADRTTYYQGDFVEYADDVPAADIVTLDRVICCYPDLDRLAARAAERTQDRLGLVHPRDHWWMRTAMTLYNAAGRLFRAPRFFVHRTARLEVILRSAGLEPEWAGGTRFWRVAVYRRVKG